MNFANIRAILYDDVIYKNDSYLRSNEARKIKSEDLRLTWAVNFFRKLLKLKEFHEAIPTALELARCKTITHNDQRELKCLIFG